MNIVRIERTSDVIHRCSIAPAFMYHNKLTLVFFFICIVSLIKYCDVLS